MADIAARMRPPKNILLATDLGSHSDRALDRAAQLARQWGATLHIVHAIRPETTDLLWPSATQAWRLSSASTPQVSEGDIAAVRRQICHDLREPLDDLVVHVATGKPAGVIVQTAQRERCELIIIGCGAPPFAGLRLHTTSAELLQSATQSVLVVKSRPQGAYARVLVGTDFTRESRHGLKTAIAWLPDAHYALLHALDIPYQSMLLNDGRDHVFARLERDTMAAYVADLQLPDAVRERVRTRVEHGPAETMLREYSIDHDCDLTVVGALKRGLAFRMLVGGSATRIAQSVPGDILMVRAETDSDAA